MLKIFFKKIMCMDVLPTHISVYHVRPEGVGFPETGVTDGVSCHVKAGNQPRSSGMAASALN